MEGGFLRLGFWVLDLSFWLLGDGFDVLGVGFQVLGLGFGLSLWGCQEIFGVGTDLRREVERCRE